MSEFLEDQTLTCRDCNQPFIFGGGEQKFFAEKGFTPPSRCKGCRQKRKMEKEGGDPSAAARTAFAPPAGVVEVSNRRGAPPVATMTGSEMDSFHKGGGSRRGGGKHRRDDRYDD